MSVDETVVRGVRLRDVYRDKNGDLWEVIALCTEPQATVDKVGTDIREQHVIGCLNWNNKWATGPLRPPDAKEHQT